MDRRQFLATSIALSLAWPFANAFGFTKGREVAPMPKQFKPGDYIWYPQISPAGPVAIVVSIPDQQLFVFRNGVRIGRSTVSTGATGHSTPTGVFTILEKNVTNLQHWLEKLQTMLKSLVAGNGIAVSVDTKLKAGAKWKDQIESTLAARGRRDDACGSHASVG